MNKTRRKELYMIEHQLSNINVTENDLEFTKDLLRDIKLNLESILYDEESYMENIPENLQNSERYYAAEEAVDNLENAMNCLDDAISYDDFDDIFESINDVINYIDDATA